MQTAAEIMKSIPEYGEIPVSGDWHGQKGWGSYMIRLIAESTASPAIFHLGDFGFWPRSGGQKFLSKIHKALELHDKWIFVTAGNHEDYQQISTFSPVADMPGCVRNPRFPRIIVLARGYTWEWLGKKFMSVGGANSIDRDRRTQNIDWWAGEQISGLDVYNSIQYGKVDVLFSHDAPSGVRIFGSHREPDAWPATSVQYSNESREQLRLITDVIQPRLMFHGHYHMPLNMVSELGVLGSRSGEFYSIHSRGLDKDYSGDNIGVFDIEKEEFHHIEIPKPDWKFPYKIEEAWWLEDPADKRTVWWN